MANSYFPVWLTTLLIAGWIAYGGEEVITGSIQLGSYIATINVFKNVGDSIKDLFSTTLDFSRAIGPIQKITALMNLPTELVDMKKLAADKHDWTREWRTPEKLEMLRKECVSETFGDDKIPIEIKNLSFLYKGEQAFLPSIRDVNLTCEQGELVAIVGPKSGGKTTLMRVLGQVLIPTTGSILAPTHLRILHVTESPSLLSKSIWQNLCIGRSLWTNEDFETKRVIRICERLGCSKRVMELLYDGKDRFLQGKDTAVEVDGSWSRELPSSDIQLLHLARAFIYSPEIMVMHRPTQRLSPSASVTVYELLREFIDNRGVDQPAATLPTRRPRTAFVSFARLSGAKMADRSWLVERGRAREVQQRELSGLDVY